MVVKENKDSYAWAPTDWDSAIKIYDEARSMAKNFNIKKPCTKSIEYVEVEVSKYKLGYVKGGSTAFKVQKDFKCGSTMRNVA